jgi:hypothetical protein
MSQKKSLHGAKLLKEDNIGKEASVSFFYEITFPE